MPNRSSVNLTDTEREAAAEAVFIADTGWPAFMWRQVNDEQKARCRKIAEAALAAAPREDGGLRERERFLRLIQGEAHGIATGEPSEDHMAEYQAMARTIHDAATALLASPVASRERITHGRHCICSACAAQDWTEPQLAACGMHGPSCPPVYAPLGAAGESIPVASREDEGERTLLDLIERLYVGTEPAGHKAAPKADADWGSRTGGVLDCDWCAAREVLEQHGRRVERNEDGA